jgi:uncharacterized protein YndB with AHSA1/START domain
MGQQTSETVIQKSVLVAVPAERAFTVFAQEMHTWWPLRTHAVDTKDPDTVILEGREGGRFFERTAAGEEHLWGTVVTWEPPHRLGYTWHPGRGEETAQEVEVTFEAEGDGTRVDLRHWGWEKLGERMEEVVADYEDGWDTVIGEYVERVNA